MTKREKDEAFNEYAKRGPRELAGLLVQADEAFEKRSKKEAPLRSQLLSLQSRNEKLEEALRLMLEASECEDARKLAEAMSAARELLSEREGE
jgi:hypothetical protein